MKDCVSTIYVDDYDIDVVSDAFRESFASLEVFKTIKPKMKVLIKVCLPNDEKQDSGEVTNPNVVCGLIKVLNEMGVECIVADSPMHGYSPVGLENLYVNTGLLSIANLVKCELNHNLKSCNIETPYGVRAKSITVLDVINDVDAIINVGKVKMDDSLGYLGAVSNLFGLVPGEIKEEILNRTSTQKDFSNYCIDILEAVKDKLVLNILDAIVTFEAKKTQRLLYCLAMSENAFSLDAVMLDILGVDKSKSVLKQAENRGLFSLSEKIKVLGDGVEKFKQEDYALVEIGENKKIHKSDRKVKRYFKSHQKRVCIDGTKCKGCAVCSKICPTNAIVMKYDKNGELFAHVDYSKCIYCNKCHTACPYGVVDIKTPRKYTKIHNKIDKYNKEN